MNSELVLSPPDSDPQPLTVCRGSVHIFAINDATGEVARSCDCGAKSCSLMSAFPIEGPRGIDEWRDEVDGRQA